MNNLPRGTYVIIDADYIKDSCRFGNIDKVVKNRYSEATAIRVVNCSCHYCAIPYSVSGLFHNHMQAPNADWQRLAEVLYGHV